MLIVDRWIYATLFNRHEDEHQRYDWLKTRKRYVEILQYLTPPCMHLVAGKGQVGQKD